MDRDVKRCAVVAFLAAIVMVTAIQAALAESQGDMNVKASRDFVDADQRLNVVYAAIMASLDKEGKKALTTSERAWLAYRESQARFEADMVARGGSMAPLIYNETRAAMTEARIKELKKTSIVR